MQAVEQRVRHLVRDDVAGQAGEHHRSRRRRVAFACIRRESSRTAAPSCRGCNRHCWSAARADRCAAAALRNLARLVAPGAPVRRPQRAAAERLLEMADGRHRDGVDHLLVKLRIAFGRRPAVLRQQDLVVQVDRLVDLVRRRIDVDDLEILADRPGLQRAVLACRPMARASVVSLTAREVETLRHARIERVDAQAAADRRLLALLPEDRRRGAGVVGAAAVGARRQRRLQHRPQWPRRIAAVQRRLEVSSCVRRRRSCRSGRSGSSIALSTSSTCCAICVSSSASIARRCAGSACPAKLTPPPKIMFSHDHDASAGGSFVSLLSAGGRMSSAASGLQDPLADLLAASRRHPSSRSTSGAAVNRA